MRSTARVLVLFLSGSMVAIPAQPENPAHHQPTDRLRTAVEETWDGYLELYPRLATETGDHRFDHLFGNELRPEHSTAVRALCDRGLAAVRHVDPGGLDEEDRLTLELFRRWLATELGGLAFPGELMPVSNLPWSPQNLLAEELAGRGTFRFETVADYEAFLSRAREFAGWVDTAAGRLAEGAERGVVLPCPVVRATLEQLDGIIASPPRSDTFRGPIREFPGGLTAAERRRLVQVWDDTIAATVLPAYRKLREAIASRSLPGCRETLSLAELPDGADWYRFLTRFYTTTELEPAEILQLGVDESRRLVSELQTLARAEGHADLGSFVAELDRDRRNFAFTERALLGRYARIRETVEKHLGGQFLEVPSAPLEIRPRDRRLGGSGPGAYYRPPDDQGTRPGVFVVDTSRLPTSIRSAEALFLHEALPGHHLQLSLARELDHLPRFRRHLYQGAYIEGWALYAEGLGDQLGLYREPAQRSGRLLMNLLRSARLVVDVGLHDGGWSRAEAEQAIRRSLLGVNLYELDRYATIPGQALGYKVGELKLRELRRRAEVALGRSFDPRTFHHEVLRHGLLPLDLLEEVVDRWIEGQREAADSPVATTSELAALSRAGGAGYTAHTP